MTNTRPCTALLASLALLATLGTGCATQLQMPSVSREDLRVEQEKQRELALATRWQREKRLMKVSSRILVAGAELCGKYVQPHYGLHVGSVADFTSEFRSAAESLFGRDERVRVWYVAPDSAADDAWLMEGDVVLAINGKRIKRTKDALRALAKSQYVRMEIERKGSTRTLGIRPKTACGYRIQVIEQDMVNAFADGKNVILAQGMLRFASTDEELALVVGHEVAHNALGHLKRTTANQMIGILLGGAVDVLAAAGGINTGGDAMRLGGNIGGRAFSQGFEKEADYMGVYLAARAGYGVSNAPMFWRRMAIEHPGSIKENYMSSHPSSPERSIRLEQAVKEIARKRARGAALVPARKNSSPE